MIEALAHAGIPTIPVRVWHEGKWRKKPLVDKWDDATADGEVLARWERKWPGPAGSAASARGLGRDRP